MIYGKKLYIYLKNHENAKFFENFFAGSLNLSYTSLLFIAIGRLICKTPPEN